MISGEGEEKGDLSSVCLLGPLEGRNSEESMWCAARKELGVESS